MVDHCLSHCDDNHMHLMHRVVTQVDDMAHKVDAKEMGPYTMAPKAGVCPHDQT